MANILVVDDEPKIVDMIEKFLVREGHRVGKAHDGRSGLHAARTLNYDLIVLDVMLPERDGFQVLEDLRGLPETADIPVILLTARSLESDKLLGLGLGADDYLTKPFSLRELALRIKAILKRAGKHVERKRVSVGDIAIDPVKMSVTVGAVPVELTKAEFQILYTLLSKPGRVFTREELMSAAFGMSYSGYERTIDTHIWNLRRKIEKDPGKPAYVITVFGVGYKGGEPADGEA